MTIRFLVLLSFLAATAAAESAERQGASAARMYEDGKYEESLKEFQGAAAEAPDDFRLKVGEGASLYRLGRFDEARAAFIESASRAELADQKAAGFYNAGNSLVQLRRYADAIKAYEESLRLNPEDIQAKDNLEYARKMLEEQEQQKKQEQEQQKKQEQEKKEESKENQQSSEQSSSSESSSSSSSSASDSQQGSSDLAQSSESSESRRGDAQESSRMSEGTGSSSSETRQASGGESDKETERRHDIETLLNNLEESRSELQEFREEQVRQELRRRRQRAPEKDW